MKITVYSRFTGLYGILFPWIFDSPDNPQNIQKIVIMNNKYVFTAYIYSIILTFIEKGNKEIYLQQKFKIQYL